MLAVVSVDVTGECIVDAHAADERLVGDCRETVAMKRPCIAVLDDEPGVRKGLSRLLRTADLEPQSYASGQEFLDAWELQPPDCLVMDLQMPGISGFEVQAKLKRAGAHVPIIIVTAHDEPETQRRCIELGAIAYLRKPLDGESLLDVIWSALEAQRP